MGDIVLYGSISGRPVLEAYDARLAARPAYKRAAEANWPPPETAS